MCIKKVGAFLLIGTFKSVTPLTPSREERYVMNPSQFIWEIPTELIVDTDFIEVYSFNKVGGS
jgi:hypothetical protein